VAERPDSRAIEPAQLRRELEQIHLDCFGWAVACCRGDRDQAEEVLQSSYLKAMAGRATFNGHSGIRTWFFGVVKRTAAEQRRSHFVRSAALARWVRALPSPRSTPTPEAMSDRAEVCNRLAGLLAELSPRQRDLLHLVFYQEMTIEQAAEVLGISVGTARTHYERGKARLRAQLQGAGEQINVASRA
jgi:RNA polymerase sigma-70 factor (ECF subfamily)